MTESKHVLTSKLFLTGLVTLLSGIAMAIAGHYGITLDINPTIQGGLVTVIGGLVMYWRKRPTKALHVKKPKGEVVESIYAEGGEPAPADMGAMRND